MQVLVVADFSTATATGGVFQVALASTGVTMKDSANNDVTSFIGFPTNGPSYTFIGGGSATLSLNSNTPTSSLLTPGSTQVEVARYTLAAQNDDLKLTNLYLYNVGTSAADLSSRVLSVGLYNASGSKLADGSIVGTGVVSFSLGDNSSFIVPKDTSNTVVSVRMAFNDITDGNITARGVQLAVGTGSISASSVVNGTSNGVRLVSNSTGTPVVSPTVTNAISNASLIVRSAPVVSMSSNVSGTSHEFSVTASANNKLTLSGVVFTMGYPDNTNTDTPSYTLYKNDQTNGNVVATGALAIGGNTITASLSTPVEISAGTTMKFILVVSTPGSTTTNAKRTFKITDVSYIDDMNTNGNYTVSTVGAYSNTGLPTTESVYSY